MKWPPDPSIVTDCCRSRPLPGPSPAISLSALAHPPNSAAGLSDHASARRGARRECAPKPPALGTRVLGLPSSGIRPRGQPEAPRGQRGPRSVLGVPAHAVEGPPASGQPGAWGTAGGCAQSQPPATLREIVSRASPRTPWAAPSPPSCRRCSSSPSMPPSRSVARAARGRGSGGWGWGWRSRGWAAAGEARLDEEALGMLSVAGEFVAIGQVVAEHQQWIGGLGHQRPRCHTGHWLLLDP